MRIGTISILHRKKYAFITEGSIPQAIIKLALPLMFSMLLQNVLGLVDMYYVGKLGKLQLAAVTMSSLLMRFIYTFVLGASIGTVALVSRFYGSGDIKNAKEAGKQSIFLGGILFLFLAVAINAALLPILKYLGASPKFINDAVIYGRILITGSFTLFIPMAISSYMQGSGDTVTPMIALILSVVANIILDPILIFGKFGFPALGVAGSAIATVISRGLGFAYLIWHITFISSELHFSIFPMDINFEMIWRIVKVGIFNSIQGIIRNLATLAIMQPVALFGAGAVAAYGVGVRLRMVILLPIAGLGMSTATMVGQNLGANKQERASKTSWLSVAVGEVLIIIASALLLLKSGDIISFFNTDPSVVKNGILYFKYFAPVLPFLCLSIILERALGGAGDTFSPMIVTLLFTLVLRVGLARWLVSTYSLDGVWSAYALSILLHGVVITSWFLTGKWKEKKV